MPGATSSKIEFKSLCVALDFSELKSASLLIDSLSDYNLTYKIGPELMLAGGLELIRKLKRTNQGIFLDLKLHDIPNTVSKSVLKAAELGVDYVTVHIAGGHEMIAASQSALKSGGYSETKLIGITVLTSFDEESWGETLSGTQGNVSNSVTKLAGQGLEWGLDGFVCSAKEVGAVKSLAPDSIRIVPGIRLDGDSAGDQKRVVTPVEAFKAGASMIVVGRSITSAADPQVAVSQILSDTKTFTEDTK